MSHSTHAKEDGDKMSSPQRNAHVNVYPNLIRALRLVCKFISYRVLRKLARYMVKISMADMGENEEFKRIHALICEGCILDLDTAMRLLRFCFGEVVYIEAGLGIVAKRPAFFANQTFQLERQLDKLLQFSDMERSLVYHLCRMINTRRVRTSAPRDLARFENMVRYYLQNTNFHLTLDDFKEIFGRLDYVLQAGPDNAIIACGKNLVSPHQQYWPLENYNDYPTAGNFIAKTLFGKVMGVKIHNQDAVVKVFDLRKVRRRVRINDKPHLEMFILYYLNHASSIIKYPVELNGYRFRFLRPSPYIIGRIATTMDDRETFVYSYQFRQHSFFDWIAAHFPADKKKSNKEMSKWEAARQAQFAQLCAGLKYMHTLGFAHRDLKLENIVMTRDGKLQIIDFGCARRFAPYDRTWYCRDRVGTAYYMSPECYQKNYDAKANDVWCLGVILFMMMFACPPCDQMCNSDRRFVLLTNGSYLTPNGPHDPHKPYETLENLLRAYGFKKPTDALMDLFRRIFVPEEQRITLDELLRHPFVAELYSQLDTGFICEPMTDENIEMNEDVPNSADSIDMNDQQSLMESLTWWNGLDGTSRQRIVQLASQGTSHYGVFSNDVIQDLISKFGLTESQTRDIQRILVGSARMMQNADENIEMNEDVPNSADSIDTNDQQLRLDNLPWWNGLDEKSKQSILQLASQGTSHYGGFSNDVIQDLISKFGLTASQARQIQQILVGNAPMLQQTEEIVEKQEVAPEIEEEELGLSLFADDYCTEEIVEQQEASFAPEMEEGTLGLATLSDDNYDPFGPMLVMDADISVEPRTSLPPAPPSDLRLVPDHEDELSNESVRSFPEPYLMIDAETMQMTQVDCEPTRSQTNDDFASDVEGLFPDGEYETISMAEDICISEMETHQVRPRSDFVEHAISPKSDDILINELVQ